MNIGAVGLLSAPVGGDATDVRRLFATALARRRVAPPWRRCPSRSLTSLGQWYWRLDADADLDYHVQFDALPQPGGIAELWRLVSRLHSRTLDRTRPLWRLHLIEGLDDGRYAFYIKVHHALTDGVSALRLLRRSFGSEPDRRGMPALWEASGPDAAEHRSGDPAAGAPGLAGTARGIFAMAADVAGTVPALLDTTWRALRGRSGPLTLAAPRTPFSGPIGGARSVVGCAVPLRRLQRVAERAGATVNDVVLAMCSGALRRYLLSRNALPGKPLVAMVPVALRTDQPADRTAALPGNKIGVLMCSLATHLDDPAARLAAVQADMRDGKAALVERTRVQALAIGALGAAPLGLTMLIGGGLGLVRPPSVMISSIPGPPGRLYWNGARLDELYPLSVPVDGQTLNITCTGLDDRVMFGLTACRRAVPAIDTLAGFLGSELDRLDVTPISAGRRARDQRVSRSARRPVRVGSGDRTATKPPV